MVKIAESQNEKRQLDELLWRVLWEPLQLPRDIRSTFGLPGEEIELVAIRDGTVVGGLVAFRVNHHELEIRHLAVESAHQRKSIGSDLMASVSDLARREEIVGVRTYARNTSYAFFERMGFDCANDEWIEHPEFIRHGIKFRLLERSLK